MRTCFEETIAELRSNGVRLTPQRQLILRYLKETHHHPTAEQVHQEVSKALGGISLATVYNTLHTLTKLGVIRELAYGDGSSRYDGNDTEHAHLVCESCGAVMDVEAPHLEDILPATANEKSFSVHSYRLEFYGRCKECETSEKTASN
ncbi:peroxide-responsive transcriptional repressor PerR [Effusibacillus dendaii]|uniref:Peroxide-responsive transcriptional repressor PerR n=2 Tax=Effusibacillus dendaii TaxID=2743772 RepID=A0A7I8DKL8_9BACL|nr:peroxide-responsive transcriptional repressor PerR [Effusibacillus dendaii]